MLQKLLNYAARCDTFVVNKFVFTPAYRQAERGKMHPLVKVDKKDDIAIVTLVKPEVTVEENEVIKKDLEDLVKGGARKIVLNFSNVKFMSSVVLATLISCYKDIKQAKGAMKLCCLSERVKDVFDVTELSKIFPIFQTQEDAIESLSEK
ncbi:MAG: STAS domain-containing protein [Candidatus Omnitrophota bacterium]